VFQLENIGIDRASHHRHHYYNYKLTNELTAIDWEPFCLSISVTDRLLLGWNKIMLVLVEVDADLPLLLLLLVVLVWEQLTASAVPCRRVTSALDNFCREALRRQSVTKFWREEQ